jgi:hypothetical protein
MYELLSNYVNAAIRVEEEFLNGNILDLDTYMTIRLDSCGVYSTLANAV